MDIKYLTHENFVGFNNYKVSAQSSYRPGSLDAFIIFSRKDKSPVV